MEWHANDDHHVRQSRLLAYSECPAQSARGIFYRRFAGAPHVWLIEGATSLSVGGRGKVADFAATDSLERVLAQVDVVFSNSMIEAWWRSLKHWWLYRDTLDTRLAVQRLTFCYASRSVDPACASGGLTALWHRQP